MLKRKQWISLALLIALATIAGAYQNCAPAISTGTKPEASAPLQSSANTFGQQGLAYVDGGTGHGEGYPGDPPPRRYENYATACPQAGAATAALTVTYRGHAVLVRKDCQDIAPQTISASGLQIYMHLDSLAVHEGRLFEDPRAIASKFSKRPTGIFCRHRSNNGPTLMVRDVALTIGVLVDETLVDVKKVEYAANGDAKHAPGNFVTSNAYFWDLTQTPGPLHYRFQGGVATGELMLTLNGSLQGQLRSVITRFGQSVAEDATYSVNCYKHGP